MEITDKKVIWDGTVVYLAGRNFIRNSESPEWEIETDESCLTDLARADISSLPE